MKGMYSVPNSLNYPSDYLDKMQELPYSEQTIKTYKSLFEEFIQYCHKDELAMLNTFINCGKVLQRTYSKMGLIYAISSVCRDMMTVKPMKLARMYQRKPSKDKISI